MKIAETLKLLSGAFQGVFSGTLTDNRNYTIPDKSGTIALLSDIASPTRPTTWDTTKPTAPVNQQLWFEPMGHDVPWEWNSATSLWLGPVRHLILPVSTALISSQTSNRCDHPFALPDTTHGIYIRNVMRIGMASATGSSTTACWNVLFGWWNGTSNTLVQLNSFTTATYTSANQVYRNNTTVNANYINPFGLYVNYTKTGAPPATAMSVVVDYRLSRT